MKLQRLFKGGMRPEDNWAALVAQGDHLVIVGTGKLDVRLEIPFSSGLPQGQVYYVPLKSLGILLEFWDEGGLQLEPAPEGVLLKKGSTEVVAKGGALDPSLFSLLEPPAPEGVRLDLPPSTLKEALKGVAYSLAREDYAGPLRGISLRRKEGILRLAGTDRYRLALWEGESPGEDLDVVLPGETVKEILPILDEVEEASWFFTDTSYLLLLSGEKFRVTLAGGLMGGTYPQYEAHIPSEGIGGFALEASHLLETLTLARGLEIERVELRVETGEGRLLVRGDGIAGSFARTIPFSSAWGEGGTYHLSVPQLAEALENIGGEVEFLFTGPKTPLRITRRPFTAILVPLNVI